MMRNMKTMGWSKNRTWVGILMPVLVAGVLFSTAAPAADSSSGTEELLQLSRAFKEVAAKVSPSVVKITVEKRVSDGDFAAGLPPDFFKGTPFEEFFRGREFPERRRIPRKVRGQGSGIIFSEDGHILTNNHVVEDADKVEVQLKNGDTYEATIVGTDPKSDLAVVKIEAEGLQKAVFGDSDKIEQGDWAIAIGSPFELDYTLTVGVVSAKHRSNLRAMQYQDFLQTDASINPGNSGGPLCNIHGEVIGVNTMIAGLNTGIGFAIPSNMAVMVAEQLIEHGKVRRPYIGIGLQSLEGPLKDQIEGAEYGAVVNQVYEDSPAEKAGLEPYDVIVRADDQEIRDADDLVNYVIRQRIGDEIELGIIRDGKKKTITVKTEEMPAGFGERPGAGRTGGASAVAGKLGLELEELTSETADALDYPGEHGVVVSQVEPGGPAAEAGLRRGDVIREIARKPVDDVEEAYRRLGEATGEHGVLLRVWREGNTFFTVLKGGEEED